MMVVPDEAAQRPYASERSGQMKLLALLQAAERSS